MQEKKKFYKNTEGVPIVSLLINMFYGILVGCICFDFMKNTTGLLKNWPTKWIWSKYIKENDKCDKYLKCLITVIKNRYKQKAMQVGQPKK